MKRAYDSEGGRECKGQTLICDSSPSAVRGGRIHRCKTHARVMNMPNPMQIGRPCDGFSSPNRFLIEYLIPFPAGTQTQERHLRQRGPKMHRTRDRFADSRAKTSHESSFCGAAASQRPYLATTRRIVRPHGSQIAARNTTVATPCVTSSGSDATQASAAACQVSGCT